MRIHVIHWALLLMRAAVDRADEGSLWDNGRTVSLGAPVVEPRVRVQVENKTIIFSSVFLHLDVEPWAGAVPGSRLPRDQCWRSTFS